MDTTVSADPAKLDALPAQRFHFPHPDMPWAMLRVVKLPLSIVMRSAVSLDNRLAIHAFGHF